MHGMQGFTHSPRKRQQNSRRRLRRGKNVAVKRAFTAAQIFRNDLLDCTSIDDAAEKCGASHGYTWAANVILAAQNPTLVEQVIRDDVSMFAAAELVARKVKVLKAITDATSADVVEAIKTYGLANFWDDFIVPAIDGKTENVPVGVETVPPSTEGDWQLEPVEGEDDFDGQETFSFEADDRPGAVEIKDLNA